MDEELKTTDIPVKEPKQEKPKKAKKDVNRLLLPALIVLLLMGSSAAGAYFWQQAVINSNKVDRDALQQRVKTLESQIKTMNKSTQVDENGSDKGGSQAIIPTQSTIDNVQNAIKSGNTSALLDLFAPNVDYILAASGSGGIHTPAQAVEDLNYLSNAKSPWNFELPKTELDTYTASQSYGKYFPASQVVVGKSADNMLVSFTFNNDGKISALFISADASIVRG